MFGYIRYSKGDLTFREFHIYRSYYCGVCKMIKKNFGEINRLTLNYDIVFLAILLSSIYTKENEFSYESCILSPFNKKRVVLNECVEYCTYINMLLVYHKLLDDHLDDNSLKALAVSKLINKKYLKAKSKYNDKAENLKVGLEKLHKLEQAGNETLENMSHNFGETFGELFVYKDDDKYAETLRKLGYNLGKYIYILDSYEDFPEDSKRKRYNPLANYEHSDILPKTESIINSLINELGIISKELELNHMQGLVDNVIIFGLRNKANIILKRKEEAQWR
ncbi:MAG TPA: hypothetical protein DEP72_07035 [Clostridiales bacterium]|nr:MAG: hypothetical protein A2Y18_08465 [Clostridiales bacterium GWD2_32_19]HCC07894.1 hypothetical protein [Clostridiales bacterium]